MAPPRVPRTRPSAPSLRHRFAGNAGRRKGPNGRGERADHGSLMIVSGILLVLAFAVTALTLSQIADLEKRVASETNTPILSEYRFLREKLGSTLSDSVTRQTTITEFKTIFSSAQSELKALAHQAGYDLLLYLPTEDRSLGKTEWSFTEAGHPSRYSGALPAPFRTPDAVNTVPSTDYFVRAYDNSFNWEPSYGGSRTQWDGTNDGVLWTPAADADHPGCQSNTASSCVQGVVAWLYLADQSTAVSEFIVYGVNT